MLRLLHTFSWQELLHHRWRNAAAVAAVMLGVALAFSVQLINASALSEFSQAVRSVNGQPDLELRAVRGSFDEALYARVANHPEVAAASPVLELGTYALGADGKRVALRVVGVDALVVARLAPALMPVPAADTARLALFIPGAVFLNAAAQQALAGQRLRLQSGLKLLDVQVAGSVAAGGAPLAVMDIGAAQELFSRTGQLSRIDLRLQAGSDRAAFIAALQLPATLTATEPGDDAQRVSNLSRAYRVNLTVLALVALFTGAFLVFSVLSLSVAKRAQQFALLGVLGLTGRERLRLVLWESALLGIVGSVAGIALGTVLATLALRLLGGDLGGGYFSGVAPALQWDAGAALIYGLLGVAAALVGGWWPARAAQKLPPAQTLKGLGAPSAGGTPWRLSLLLIAAAGLLALTPPVFGIALGAYLSVGLLLVGGISALPWLIALLYDRIAPHVAQHLLPLLAVERARRVRGSAAVAVSGVVASLSLAVALTVMVASFRDSVTHWLDVVLPADVYVRTASNTAASDTVYFSPDFVQALAQVPGVARTGSLRVTQLLLDAGQPAVALIARDLQDPAASLPLVGEPLPVPAGQVAIYVSEPMVDLYGAQPGRVFAPLTEPFRALTHTGQAPTAINSGANATASKTNPRSEGPPRASDRPLVGQRSTQGDKRGGEQFFVAGVWRDYARQFGAIAMDQRDFERLTGDRRVNDLALWLAPGAAEPQVQQAVRALAQAQSPGAGELIEFASSSQIRASSLRIFDRSFAVTYWLQAVAIAIGLFGVAASFSAQVLARRKEFGLLAHLGLTRRQILTLVAGEGAAWTLAGALAGLGLGLAVSLVLVHVVNPQSFHWTMDLALPWPRLLALCAAVVLAGTVTAWLAGRAAAGRDAVLAVKEDW
ncbi:ABC transporter permease [Polaromonas eurypsychrophila]|uniref:Permease n=1 Tax=Polaromonas eurypsychrophila TaxID=1614635 RepID=A0A916SU85_9BURK|nr:FtsX-like permease family protein [Polaromonas eurypsychrophila]GGB13886.1 permease [Polaromonas eurypsychrophila]